MPIKGVAMTWFREEDWPRWLEIDPSFQPDYQHWLRRAEDVLSKPGPGGATIVKMPIDPEKFLAWAKAEGQGVDTNARSIYAAMLLRGRKEGH